LAALVFPQLVTESEVKRPKHPDKNISKNVLKPESMYSKTRFSKNRSAKLYGFLVSANILKKQGKDSFKE